LVVEGADVERGDVALVARRRVERDGTGPDRGRPLADHDRAGREVAGALRGRGAHRGDRGEEAEGRVEVDPRDEPPPHRPPPGLRPRQRISMPIGQTSSTVNPIAITTSTGLMPTGGRNATTVPSSARRSIWTPRSTSRAKARVATPAVGSSSRTASGVTTPTC